MKLTKPSYQIWNQEFPVRKMDDYSGSHFREQYTENMYKQIERVARVCYKSEDKIKEGSAEKMVNALIKSEHYAMLEHGTVYLKFPNPEGELNDDYLKYEKNRYSYCNLTDNTINYCYVTTNLRVIIENHWEDDLQYLCEPTEYHERRVTVHFICNRQVSHEFVRHRVFSFAQESTRYCNYSKTDKFGEMTFIIPTWCNLKPGSYFNNNKITELIKSVEMESPELNFILGLISVEKNYNYFIEQGWKAQQAATILPNAIKTELVMTGFVSDWKHFFDLRALGTTGKPHPQAKELAEPLMYEFKENGLYI